MDSRMYQYQQFSTYTDYGRQYSYEPLQTLKSACCVNLVSMSYFYQNTLSRVKPKLPP